MMPVLDNIQHRLAVLETRVEALRDEVKLLRDDIKELRQRRGQVWLAVIGGIIALTANALATWIGG